MELTWERKLEAIAALAGTPIAVHMRKPGEWYTLSGGIEIGDGHMLASSGGRGVTPEAAVMDHWEKLTTLPEDKFIVIFAMDPDKRRHLRWNGFMWQQLAREETP